MAVVSPARATVYQDGPTSYAEAPTIMISTSREIVEEPVAAVGEDVIYVAVGKDVKECVLILQYALKSSGGKKICLLHVHVPAQMIPLMGTKFPANSLKKQEVKAYREIEKQNMLKALNEYILVCQQAKVLNIIEKLHIEAESIEKGIVDLISLYGIKKLVMGAAADKYYSRRMVDLRSRKAIHVSLQAPAFCHIEFVCKGNLIYTRGGSSHGAQAEVSNSSPQASPDSDVTGIVHYRSRSLPVVQLNGGVVGSPVSGLPPRGRSLHGDFIGRVQDPSSPGIMNGLHTPNRLDVKETCDGWGLLPRRSPSQRSDESICSPSSMASIPLSRVEESENGLEDGQADDCLYNQYERVMMETANARREAFLEAVRRKKSEKETSDALRRVKAAEVLYAEELKQRKEIEEELSNEKRRLESIKNQLREEMEELRIARDQKARIEKRLSESDLTVKELEQKILSAVDLLQNYKRERDELQIQRDNALREAEELRENRESLCPHIPQFYSEFPFWEIEEATKNFDPSLKIGEGGYGNIYKGHLRHTTVAIKILHSDSAQGPSEFQQEVDVLSKMRHPNLVTLIGTCPEAWVLIYEYLSNGSLEDRLNCKDNTPPLSWQMRIRIITELCSALMFLHSSKPHSIVHGDLKPANVLLDANYVCKLGDFGICRLLSRDDVLGNTETLVCRTDNPKGTFAYMDPEFLSTGELTTKSDVYSFGIILLRLLTGRSAMGISREVQFAMGNGKLKSILDPLAGDWPFVQAEQLARLALRCCDLNRKSRPDLVNDVWRVLEPMRASCGGLSSVQLGSAKHLQSPPYYICPIFQEVMQDPHVAADGFTYEAEAVRGWLDSGHDTSPMTNLKLEHRNLVPNRALRSAIQEWLQRN